MENHKCVQEPRIERTEVNMDKIISDIGEIKGLVQQIPKQYERLDTRINGSFTTISEHINDSNNWRSRIIVLETAVSNLKVERITSRKASEWRVALIVSAAVGFLSNIDKILNILLVISGTK